MSPWKVVLSSLLYFVISLPGSLQLCLWGEASLFLDEAPLWHPLPVPQFLSRVFLPLHQALPLTSCRVLSESWHLSETPTSTLVNCLCSFFFFFLYFGEDSVCHSNTLARAGSQQVRGASALPLFFLKTSSVLSPWLLRSPVTTNLLLFSAPSDMRLTLSLLCFLLPFTAVTRHHRNLPSGSWPHSVWRRSHHTVAFASLSSSTLSFWSLSQGGPDFPRLLDYLVCLLLWLRVPLAGHTVVFPKGLLLPSPPVPSLHDVPYSWGSRSPPMQMSWNGWF